MISTNLGRYIHLYPVRSVSVSMTSGLVQDIEHQVLPIITPAMTFILTFLFMIVNKQLIIFNQRKFFFSQV